MEKLDLLAQRIDSLIQELNRLREENHSLREEGKRLREDLELGQMASDELQEKLNAAVSVREEAASRVDALIGRIQSVLPMAEEQQNG
jgi:regulator of replication initiation timing